MSTMGIGEVVLVLIICAFSLLPIAVAVWVLVTLQHIRRNQARMEARLDAISESLQRR